MNELIQQLANIDTETMLFLNGMHCGFFDYFMKCISGKWIWVPFYAATLYVIIRNFKTRVAVMGVLAIVLTIVLTDQIGDSVIRPVIERLRPSNPLNPISLNIHIVDGYRSGQYGFPSCHAANTFGLAFFIAFLFRKRIATWFFIGWAVLVCYSRIHLGVHYPGDILAGCLLAFIVVCVTYSLFRLSAMRELEHPKAPHLIIYIAVTLLMSLVCATTYALLRLYMV